MSFDSQQAAVFASNTVIPERLPSLDRRVTVIDGSDAAKASIQLVSHLRSWRYVVLLGEPGMGKTTVLQQEAAIDGAVVMSVRDLLNGGQPQQDVPLYLDALDEYRSDGDAKDKSVRLSNALVQARPSAWRLSCRSEDWREGSDLRRLERAAGEAGVLVVSLEPLSIGEAACVLRALGASDPDAFLREADRYAAGAFLENPLSLRLLHTVVCSGGAWPTTRFDLFERGIDSLAFEHDPERSRDPRHAAATIVDAASKACLLLLLSNANGIWRSNLPPPPEADGGRFVTAHDLDLELTLLADLLDTALFRVDGDAFHPMHRAMAEYLGGRALAAAICGAGGQPRLPLRRAMAMIAGGDGRAPSELRGLYAWTAAHLAHLGNQTDATRLIESDAITVLAYGDAAVFPASCRQAILHNLDRHDPYFRAAESGDTAIGSLAGDDLAPDFQQILSDRTDETHRFITVTEALIYGRPVPAVRSLLWEIALDPSRPFWQRWRAVEAWTANTVDKGAAQRQLFDALDAEPVSRTRELVRIYLAANLPSTHIELDDFKRVLADYATTPRDDESGRLTSLQLRLEAEPPSALFDAPLRGWLPPKEDSPWPRMEIDHVLERVLAKAIEKTTDLSAARLWAWLNNVDEHRFSEPDKAVGKAIQMWLGAGPARGAQLFAAIVATCQPDDGPWFPRLLYITKTGQVPPTTTVSNLLASADLETDNEVRLRSLAIAVEVARESEPAGYWEAYHYLDGRQDCAALFDRLRICDEEHRRANARHAFERRRRKLEEQSKNREYVSSHSQDLPAGRPLGALRWAAHCYLGEGAGPIDFRRVVDATSPQLAQAIAAGWRHLMVHPGFGVAELGAAAGRGGDYPAESPAIAGLVHMMEQGAAPREPLLPICLALIILKSAHFVGDKSARERLEQWAVGRIESPNGDGRESLAAFWEASLDAGEAQSLCGIWQFEELALPNGEAAQCLAAMLSSRKGMAPRVLKSALVAASKLLDPASLLQLGREALGDRDVIGEQRLLWSCVVFGIDPIGEANRLHAENPAELERLFGDSTGGGLIGRLRTLTPGARIFREAVTVRLFGGRASPEAMRSPRLDPVRGAIAWLERCPDPEADAALLSLMREPGLAQWRNMLRHALATKVKARHDQAFRHPPVSAIRAALTGGAPASAADLMAVIVEQLRQIQAEIQLDPLLPWQAYWNENPKGPKIENSCRNVVAQLLQARLRPFGIVVPPMPEAQRAAETRADVLILNGAGVSLPIEAKRHFHPEVWTAASTQLQGYAADPGASGFGIYLVFWFGASWAPTPARGGRRRKPSTATEMESMLRGDLPEPLQITTEIIVLDVSDPSAPMRPARKRASGASTAKAKQTKG